jgi:hypothetical protein
VIVNMAECNANMSVRMKQRSVIKPLTADDVRLRSAFIGGPENKRL